MSLKLNNLLFIGLPLFVLPLLYFPSLVDVGLLPRFLFLSLFVGIGVAGLLEAHARKSENPAFQVRISPLLIIFVLFLFWITLRLTWSSNFSEALFEWQRSGLLFCFWFLLVQELRPLAISSTEIRTLLSAGRSPRFLLPEAVLDYIRAHRLYQ